jgi:hypothetical protein
MRREDQRDRGRFAAGAALRREAIAERPPFSEAFHNRLARRLPAVARPRPAPRRVAAVGVASLLARWAVVPLAVSVMVLAVLVLLVARPGSDTQPIQPTGVVGEASPVAAMEELLAIDRLPTPGDIEEALRETMATLAVSLLDVPEWTTLADFDAGTIRADGGR